ncbi:hypothetical protein JCM3770_004016 [Rhodotorula araucariae]
MLAQIPDLRQLPLAGLTVAGADIGGFPIGFTTTTSTGGTTGMASPPLHAQNDTAADALPSAVGAAAGWGVEGEAGWSDDDENDDLSGDEAAATPVSVSSTGQTEEKRRAKRGTSERYLARKKKLAELEPELDETKARAGSAAS